MSEVKQVIVIRKDLNMRKGKIAAQAAHASMAVLLDRMGVKYYYHRLEDDTAYGHEDWILSVDRDSPMWEWLNGPFTKIVVYVDSEEELLNVYDKAAGLPRSLIRDKGFTEFHGVLTYTAVAIGPHYSEDVDKITGDLPLL